MTALWQFGSVDIFVSEGDISREIKRSELFILDSTESQYHFFGAGSEKRHIKGLVIGEANKAAIVADAIGNTVRTLFTPYGNFLNQRIDGSPKFSFLKYSGAVIDGVSYSTALTPIWECDLDLVTAPV